MNLAEYLELLDIRAEEHIGILAIMGATQRSTAVRLRDNVAGTVSGIPSAADAFLAPNPVAGPERRGVGRGGEADVTRVAALYADLDVKEGACADLSAAVGLSTEISIAIDMQPAVLIFSGGGLQPVWTLRDCPPAVGKPLLTRFSRLVRSIADARDIHCDSVFELARVLRIPGTYNHKYGEPRLVTAIPGGGTPLDPLALAAVLDDLGIPEEAEDSWLAPSVVAPRDDWEWALHDNVCSYMPVTTRGWMEEAVPERHPWALSCMVRLECMRRYGCLTEAQYSYHRAAVENRFLNLLATQEPRRSPHRYEFSDIAAAAITRAECKSEDEISKEVGSHTHLAGSQAPSIQTPRDRGSTGRTDGNLATVTALPTAQPPQPVAAGAAADVSLTDKGNAIRLARQYGDRIRYVPQLPRWMHWTGTHWQIDTHKSAVGEAAGEIAMNLPVAPGDKAAAAHKKKSLTTNGILGMIKLAEIEPGMITAATLLDSRAYELNARNGMVDLKTGEMAEHDREAWHTKVTGVDYLPDMPTPMWNSFLGTTFQKDAEIIEFMQRLAGYACIGEVTHHILPFLYGEVGQNGKSVLLKVFQECLGTYAVTLPVAVLVADRNKHTEDIARLAGARLAVCSEIGQDSKWDEEKLKMLTGGDTISGRMLYGHRFDFTPSHLIMLAANDKPRIEAGGRSFSRRVKTIEFGYSVPDDQVNERLPQDLLEKEGPGILAWMVRGAVDVVANGLRIPKKVALATEDYAQSEDEVKQWMDECCLRVSDDFLQPNGKLYLSYKQWCERNGMRPKNSQGFGVALNRHGIPLGPRRNTARMRGGLQLIEDPDTAENRYR